MLEIFKLLGTIAIDNAEANQSINETTEKAKTAFSKIGDAAVKVGKTVAAGLAAGVTAIGALTKASVASYAEYEQLVGGVQTLFNKTELSLDEYAKSIGKSTQEAFAEWADLTSGARFVMNNADEAFRTAGLSANEYMETVTSFSASLIQSLGGDTDAAAHLADQAIIDMSDNANKMGSDMALIQNAYQGFAKQNYSMLDNLKLGYGGTQEEMYRLLCDAKEIDETFDAVFSLDSKGHLTAGYADIVEAIHIVQTEMGITGTTAREASSTIQGSLSMTKAAWKNLLTGFADDTQDLNVLTTNLVESAKTAVDNLMPRIKKVLSGIVEFVREIVPVIAKELPEMLETLLPGLIEAATSLMVGIVAAVPDILQIFLTQVPFIVSEISKAVSTAFPKLLNTVKKLFQQIWDYISLELLNTGVSFEKAFDEIEKVFEKTWAVLKDVWNSIGKPVFEMVQSIIGVVRDTFSRKMPEIKEFVSQCFSDIKSFWDNNLKPCLEAIGDFIENVLAPVFEFVFTNTIGPVVDTAFKFIKDLWNNTLKPVFTGITDFLTGVFTLNFQQAFSGLMSIIEGIWGGLVNVIKTPINAAISVVNSFIRGLNKIQIPDWVPGVGGGGINIPQIPLLAKGGVLKRGQVGLLEGSGAEAVVPLEHNTKWINEVADDMTGAVGGGDVKELLALMLEAIKEMSGALTDMDGGLTEKFIEALATMRFDIGSREFARLVKAVN